MIIARKDINGFIDRIEQLPAEIYETGSAPQTFGNWFVKFGRGGKRFRVLFDGKESTLSLQVSFARKAPENDWQEMWTAKATGQWQADLVTKIGALE